MFVCVGVVLGEGGEKRDWARANPQKEKSMRKALSSEAASKRVE